MKLLWLEREEWWGKKYVTRVGHTEAIAYENPRDNGRPTVVIKDDGKIDRVGFGQTLVAAVEMAENFILGKKNEERAAA